MKINEKNPPRQYEVGQPNNRITISDCAAVHLANDEQVTFFTPSGAEYDVTAKEWGFYATPSLNKRLLSFKLRGVLIKNQHNHFYVFLVEEGKEAAFETYLEKEKLDIVVWLDSTEILEKLGSKS